MRDLAASLRAWADKLTRDERGAVAVVMALALPVLVGALAISVDVGVWRFKQKSLQTAADAAALQAEWSLMKGATVTQAKAAALAEGLRNGFDPAKGSLTVNIPPTSGPFVATANAVEVVITSTEDRYFSRALNTAAGGAVNARAVARPNRVWKATGSGCVLSLGENPSKALWLSNNVTFTASGGAVPCDFIANSSAGDSIRLDNNASIDGNVITHGGISTGSGASVEGTATTYAGTYENPYADLSFTYPTGGCTGQSGTIGNNQTVNLTPGHFCSGLSAGNGATINLAAGTYYLSSTFAFGNNVVINGSAGVTIVMGNGVVADFGNGALLNLVAPTSGTFAGIAWTRDLTDTASRVTDIDNNSTLRLTGAVYLPKDTVTLHNNSGIQTHNGSNGCSQVLGSSVRFFNNATLGNNCVGSGTRPFGEEWGTGMNESNTQVEQIPSGALLAE